MKVFKYLLLFLILEAAVCLISQSLYAQDLQGKALADSLVHALPKTKSDTDQVKLLIKAVKALISTDPPAAMHYVDSAMSIAQQHHWQKGVGLVYINKARIYYTTSDYEAGLENSEKAYEIFKSLGWKAGMGDALSIVANNYERLGNYSKAIENNYKALGIYEQIGQDANIAWCYNNLGIYYYRLNDYPKSIENYNRALTTQKKLNDKYGIASVLDNLASVYKEQGEIKKVNEYNLEAIKLFEEIDDEPALGRIYNNRGNFLLEQNSFDSAFIYYKKTIAIAGKLGIKSSLAYANGGIGDIYLTLAKNGTGQNNVPGFMRMSKAGLLQKAHDYFYSALQFSQKAGDLSLLMRFSSSLSETNVLQGNYKTALSFYEQAVEYKDSIFNYENERKIAGLEKERLAEVKDKEIQLLNKEKALQVSEMEKKDAKAKRAKNFQYFIITTLGIVVLAVVIIALIQYRNSKHRQKANALLHQQKEKVETTLSELKSTQAQLIQREKMASLGELTAGIAHEIQNPLNFVNNFSELNTELVAEIKQELLADNKEEAISIAGDIEENAKKIIYHGKRADAIVKGMLQHSRTSTGEKELTNINALADEYLRLSYQGMRAKDKSFVTTLGTDFDPTIDKINIAAQDISRVLLNLYNNAFYAVREKEKGVDKTYEPIVSVCTKKVDHKIEIHIKDNGNGIPQKVLEKIFQPFYTTKPSGEGTGLGLSLSYDIIKAHGGEIKVETQENNGTEFILVLPVT